MKIVYLFEPIIIFSLSAYFQLEGHVIQQIKDMWPKIYGKDLSIGFTL